MTLPTRERLSARLVTDIGAQRERCEQDLDALGLPLHLFDRAAWARVRRFGKPLLLSVEDPDGRCRGAIALVTHYSRTLPGYRIVRAERCGSALSPESIAAAAAGLERFARSARVLRLSVELFGRDIAERAMLADALASRGFQRAEEPRHYATTLRVDLTPSESDILMSFSTIVRRHLKKLTKSGFELRTITQQRYVSRLDALAAEAMNRTGGDNPQYEHAAMVELTSSAPHLSRLVGVFRTGCDDPDSLVAYAWSGFHGTHGAYEVGAASRIPGVNVGFSYAVLWDLMQWTKALGGHWFDMGGVSSGGLNSDDPVGGISDFKRYFTKDVATVAEDWVLEPRRSTAAVARLVAAGARWLTKTRS